MIGVLTHHWAKADQIDEAKKLLDGNGLAQSKAPGFGSRETLYSIDDPSGTATRFTMPGAPVPSGPWPWLGPANFGLNLPNRNVSK